MLPLPALEERLTGCGGGSDGGSQGSGQGVWSWDWVLAAPRGAPAGATALAAALLRAASRQRASGEAAASLLAALAAHGGHSALAAVEGALDIIVAGGDGRVAGDVGDAGQQQAVRVAASAALNRAVEAAIAARPDAPDGELRALAAALYEGLLAAAEERVRVTSAGGAGGAADALAALGEHAADTPLLGIARAAAAAAVAAEPSTAARSLAERLAVSAHDAAGAELLAAAALGAELCGAGGARGAVANSAALALLARAAAEGMDPPAGGDPALGAALGALALRCAALRLKGGGGGVFAEATAPHAAAIAAAGAAGSPPLARALETFRAAMGGGSAAAVAARVLEGRAGAAVAGVRALTAAAGGDGGAARSLAAEAMRLELLADGQLSMRSGGSGGLVSDEPPLPRASMGGSPGALLHLAARLASDATAVGARALPEEEALLLVWVLRSAAVAAATAATLRAACDGALPAAWAAYGPGGGAGEEAPAGTLDAIAGALGSASDGLHPNTALVRECEVCLAAVSLRCARTAGEGDRLSAAMALTLATRAGCALAAALALDAARLGGAAGRDVAAAAAACIPRRLAVVETPRAGLVLSGARLGLAALPEATARRLREGAAEDARAHFVLTALPRAAPWGAEALAALTLRTRFAVRAADDGAPVTPRAALRALCGGVQAAIVRALRGRQAALAARCAAVHTHTLAASASRGAPPQGAPAAMAWLDAAAAAAAASAAQEAQGAGGRSARGRELCAALRAFCTQGLHALNALGLEGGESAARAESALGECAALTFADADADASEVPDCDRADAESVARVEEVATARGQPTSFLAAWPPLDAVGAGSGAAALDLGGEAEKEEEEEDMLEPDSDAEGGGASDSDDDGAFFVRTDA